MIDIKGMHCSGCSNLIKMTLEDEGLTDVDVDIKTNTAVFKSSIDKLAEADSLVGKIFKDLPGYSYENIRII
jgi:copper chaperone CopZ